MKRIKKTIVITGASSGIGRALYEHFTEAGDFVIGISQTGPTICADLSNKENFTFELPSQIDVLINCAGIMPFIETEQVMAVNFWGTYRMITAAISKMAFGSCIINIASVSGMRADPDLPIYAASKAAVISLTQSLAKRLAPKIRVNCISPGFHTTNLVPENTPQELIDTIPMGYEATPESMCSTVQFLIANTYITGANVVVDGGVVL